MIIYPIAVLAYFTVRFMLVEARGYPALTSVERYVLALLPVWGPFAFAAFFCLGQMIRYGACPLD